ncbi:methyl-accepting chemotaxis protein [Reinekea sp. G2M2-21]|uniref:methyl-accepting chemotaxis protein n=1 Tax=Reinekea sp. G2M2-21 TaxID=2788942 RepID=UPI0018AB18D4|nr:methyl-accepting chemotaxis protein [Reinekea sp. G2M2-21]
MNIQSIRFKYSAAFSAVALIMAFTGIFSFSLINTLKNSSTEFSQKFNPAISAVLNADRDLYQARVAEMAMLLEPGSVKDFKADYSENAKQAYDRMYVYLDLLAAYPDVVNRLKGFDAAYDQWKATSGQVVALVEQGKLDDAKALSAGNSDSRFGALREFYNIAGEAADEKGLSMGEAVISRVDSRSTRVLIFLLITVVVAFSLGIYAPRALSNALCKLAVELRGLNSGDGDLTRRVNSDRKDEIGELAREFDELLDGLSELIRGISEQSQEVVSTVGEMNTGAASVQENSRRQMESVDMIVTAVNEMTVAIKEVAQNAQLTASEIAEVNELSNKGKKITVDAVSQIQDVATTVNNASTAMGELAESSNKIASVLDVIRGIAEQTNLLALNAAIEAARAGEQGRGFAVVADEVRSLASKTQQSTDDIQKMIEALQKGVGEAVDAIAKGLESVQTSVERTSSTTEALDSIVAAAARVSDASMQIATSTEEQSQVAEDVNSNLVQLSDMGKESFENASANKDRAGQVSSVAKQLNASVTRFKLD